MTIPIICERTAGVNHAVSPSKMPRIPPSTRPSTGLFIVALLAGTSPRLHFYSTGDRKPLARTKKYQQCARDNVGEQQENPGSIASDPPPRPRQNSLGIGADRQAIEKIGDVAGKIRDRCKSLATILGFGLATDCRER